MDDVFDTSAESDRLSLGPKPTQPLGEAKQWHRVADRLWWFRFILDPLMGECLPASNISHVDASSRLTPNRRRNRIPSSSTSALENGQQTLEFFQLRKPSTSNSRNPHRKRISQQHSKQRKTIWILNNAVIVFRASENWGFMTLDVPLDLNAGAVVFVDRNRKGFVSLQLSRPRHSTQSKWHSLRATVINLTKNEEKSPITIHSSLRHLPQSPFAGHVTASLRSCSVRSEHVEINSFTKQRMESARRLLDQFAFHFNFAECF